VRFRFFLNVTPRPWALISRRIYLFFEDRRVSFLDFQNLSSSRIVGNQLPSDAASHCWRAKTSNRLQQQTRLIRNLPFDTKLPNRVSSPDVRCCCWGAPFLCLLKGIWIETHHEALVRRTEFVNSLLISEHNFQWQFILVRCVSGCGFGNITRNVACFMYASLPVLFHILILFERNFDSGFMHVGYIFMFTNIIFFCGKMCYGNSYSCFCGRRGGRWRVEV
jgi:hypothetical protein